MIPCVDAPVGWARHQHRELLSPNRSGVHENRSSPAPRNGLSERLPPSSAEMVIDMTNGPCDTRE